MINNLELHKPVLLNEMLEHLDPKTGETYLDCTFGAGGYSRAILEAANCKVYAVDRDETVQKFATQLSEKFPQNFTFCSGKFSEIGKISSKHKFSGLDGMVMDIGVSSMQLDDLKRGFSFDSEAKLDMRMDRQNPISAYEIVNQAKEEELSRIIKEFGEEPKARKIAHKIIEARKVSPITSCRDLANIVRSLYFGHFKTDPATRTFQALRIFINHELDELRQALALSMSLLKKGGRLIVVSFHSLEDQIVKNFLKTESGAKQAQSRYLPENQLKESSLNFRLIRKSAIFPSDAEIASNPRARSARLRAAIKV